MKPSTAVFLASASVAQALQQCSSGTATEEGGNWWCGVVEQILYSNVGHPGTYKAVSNMGDDGSCSFEDAAFSGPLAPFNEEVSFFPTFQKDLLHKGTNIAAAHPSLPWSHEPQASCCVQPQVQRQAFSRRVSYSRPPPRSPPLAQEAC